MTRRLPPRPRQRSRGVALLMALIIVTLVAALAAAALWRQWRAVAVEGAERARVQSSWILTGALDWGRLILAGDLRESNVDHLAEPWAVPLAEARLSTFLAAGQASTDIDRDAFLSGQITDLQARLNVMNLVTGDADSQLQAYQRFERLFQQLGLRSGELASLRDALARANAAMQAGDAKTAGDAPLLPRRFDQLAWLGVSAQTLQLLRPYVTVLPVAGAVTRVNLNTASPLVIYAVLPAIDLAHAEQMVARRGQKYFSSLQDAAQGAGLAAADVDAAWVSVSSDFFEIRGLLRLDELALQEVAVVHRSSGPARPGVITLWRERTAIAAPVVVGR